MRGAAAASLAVLGAGAILRGWRRPGWREPAVAALVLLVLAVAFLRLEPRGDRDWAEDVSRPLRATVADGRVIVHDVRSFTWRTNEDFDARWEERGYDLDAVRTLDIVNSYWAGPAIAHTLLSFGFADGRYLAFSAEIRREKGEEFSDVAGFFRSYELVWIAADERDLLGVRTGPRGEDLQIYRVRADDVDVRRLFVEILARANAVAERPAWYNTLTRNCTTELFRAARAVRPGLPFDWRIILTGFVPDWAYDAGLLDRRLPFPELRRLARAGERGRAAADRPDYSDRIRDGVPDPNR